MNPTIKKSMMSMCIPVIFFFLFVSCVKIWDHIPTPTPTCAPTMIPCIEPSFSFSEPRLLSFEPDTIGVNPFPVIHTYTYSGITMTVIALIHKNCIDDGITINFYTFDYEDFSITKIPFNVDSDFSFRAMCKANLYNSCNIGVLAGSWQGFLLYGEVIFSTSSMTVFPEITNKKSGYEIGLYFEDSEETPRPEALAPFLVDIDNNGLLDAFIGSKDGTIYFFENRGEEGKPFFIRNDEKIKGMGLSIETGWEYTIPCFVFMDGVYDLFIGESSGNIYYFKNEGTGTEARFNGYETNHFNLEKLDADAAFTLFDIDDDCYLDAFVGYSSTTDTGTGGVLFFENVALTVQ